MCASVSTGMFVCVSFYMFVCFCRKKRKKQGNKEKGEEDMICVIYYGHSVYVSLCTCLSCVCVCACVRAADKQSQRK